MECYVLKMLKHCFYTSNFWFNITADKFGKQKDLISEELPVNVELKNAANSKKYYHKK